VDGAWEPQKQQQRIDEENKDRKNEEKVAFIMTEKAPAKE